MSINLPDANFESQLRLSLQILLAIMSGAFGLAGYNFGNPPNTLLSFRRERFLSNS